MKKRIIAAALACTLAAGAFPTTALAATAGLSNFMRTESYTAGQFKDVPSNAWYAEKVKAAYELNLVKGTSATTFNPNGNLTLAEAVVLACQLHGIYNTGSTAVQPGGSPWYQPFVDYAVANGIIGAGDYSNYAAAATRAQFALILSKALPDEALAAKNNVTAIPDVAASTSGWAGAVYKLYNAGILSGSDEYGTFNPTSSIKRSEVATIVTLMADPSMRRSFTLEKKPWDPNADITIADLQGVWSYRDASEDYEAEYIFSGNNYTHTTRYKDEFTQDKGTINALVNNGSYTGSIWSGNDWEKVEGRLQIYWSGTHQTNDFSGGGKYVFKTENYSAVPHEGKYSGNEEFAIVNITEIDLDKGYFAHYKSYYDKVSHSTLGQKFDNLKNDPNNPLKKYPMYAEIPCVPDFGAIYGVEALPEIDIDDNPFITDEMKDLMDQADQLTKGMVTYHYSGKKVEDKLGHYMPAYLDVHLFDKYIDVLTECGFKKERRDTLLGGSAYYYIGYGYSVSFDVSHIELGYGHPNPDDQITIFIQPDR